jgi:hypothetical protein
MELDSDTAIAQRLRSLASGCVSEIGTRQRETATIQQGLTRAASLNGMGNQQE